MFPFIGRYVVCRGSFVGGIFGLMVNGASCWHVFILSASLSWMEVNFLNQNPCMLSWLGGFQLDIFYCCSEWIYLYFRFRSVWECLPLFCYVAYQFSFLVVFSWLPYFTPKLFSFLCTLFLVCLRAISPYLFVEFSFVVLECPVFSVFFFYLFSIYFWSPPLHELTGLFPRSALLFVLILLFFFLSQHVPPFFFCFIILCFRRFLICVSVDFPIRLLIFCSCSLKETQFPHKLISLLYRLIHLIRWYFSWYICSYFIYIFVSILTVVHIIFLCHAKVVFFIHN